MLLGNREQGGEQGANCVHEGSQMLRAVHEEVSDAERARRAESEGRKAELASSTLKERAANARTVHTTGRSERLVEELKARRFRQIFTYLDQVGLLAPC